MMIVYKTTASRLIKMLFLIAFSLAMAFAIIEKNTPLIFVVLFISAVIVYIFYATHYTVYQNKLTIRSGFLYKETIDISTITTIKKARKNLLSGPGFSSDRLIINYNKKDCVIISPSQQQAFLIHLKRINPDIIIR